MAIDPEILAVRARQARETAPFDVTALPVAEGRRLSDAASIALNDGLPEVRSVEDRLIDGPGGSLRLRVMKPDGQRGRGAILYIHGGGWFACSIETHDRMMRTLAADAGVTVVGVDFRLSPEHRYPAALHDCIAAWDWIQAHAGMLGIDAARIAVAGDSAGGNLALALMLDRRDRRLATPACGALFYACLAPGLDTESSRAFGQGGYGLTDERMQWYWRNYLGEAGAAPPVLARPLHADPRGLPPLFLGIAEADTVADDSRLLLDRLHRAGVDATLTVWRGAVHGFLQMTRDVAAARAAVRDAAGWLAARIS